MNDIYIIISYTFVLVLYAEKTKKKVYVQKLWELARIVDVLMNVLLMPIVLERKNVALMIAVGNLAYQVIYFSLSIKLFPQWSVLYRSIKRPVPLNDLVWIFPKSLY